MKSFRKGSSALFASGLFATLMTGALLLSPSATMAVHAQAAGQVPEKALPPITLDLRDAPVRQALEQLFNNAKVDFSIANEVQGFVTLKITDQPFENALRLILRSSSIPLTFVREGGVYIVKPRITETLDPNANVPPPVTDQTNTPPAASYDQIQLTYIDPADLSSTLGITFIRTFARQGNSQQGGQGGMGGMMGGMGGMGGGMMGGMGGMGGGMMGGMGGMGGGMMGGMGGMMGGGMGGMMGGGGFGGGRGF
jgi:hypothetical protein